MDLSKEQWKKIKESYDKDYIEYWTSSKKTKYSVISMEEFKKRYRDSQELQKKYPLKRQSKNNIRYSLYFTQTMTDKRINSIFLILYLITSAITWYKFEVWWKALLAPLILSVLAGICWGVFASLVKRFNLMQYPPNKYPWMFVFWVVILIAYFIG